MALQHEYKDMVLSIGACVNTLLLRSKGFSMCRGILGIGQGLARALDGVLERLKAYL